MDGKAPGEKCGRVLAANGIVLYIHMFYGMAWYGTYIHKYCTSSTYRTLFVRTKPKALRALPIGFRHHYGMVILM